MMMRKHFHSEIRAFNLKTQSITSMKRGWEDKTRGQEAGGSWSRLCRYRMHQIDNFMDQSHILSHNPIKSTPIVSFLTRYALIMRKSEYNFRLVYQNANFERSESDPLMRADFSARNYSSGYLMPKGQPSFQLSGLHHQISGDFMSHAQHHTMEEPFPFQRIYSNHVGVSHTTTSNSGMLQYLEYPPPHGGLPIYYVQPGTHLPSGLHQIQKP